MGVMGTVHQVASWDVVTRWSQKPSGGKAYGSASLFNLE